MDERNKMSSSDKLNIIDRSAVSAAEQLRADLKESRPFQNGTLVRWTSVAVNGTEFVYAAIFAEGSWFTTSQGDNRHIQKRLSHDDFLAYINTHGYSVKRLEVATAFEEVTL